MEEEDSSHPTDAKAVEELDKVAETVSRYRKRPLLVLYYDDSESAIIEDDIEDTYEQLRGAGWSAESPKPKLDVLLHTLGGSPDAAYRVAQVIRDFGKEIDYLVPVNAWSAGTLICLSANRVFLGAHAVLGPIDVTVGPDEDNEIPLASIEYYKRFVADCLGAILRVTGHHGTDWETRVDAELLVEMVRQVEAINIGDLYRSSELTGHYARHLLSKYMFASTPGGAEKSKVISERLVKEYPSHNFSLDFHLCEELGIRVEEMPESLSDSTRDLVEKLGDLSARSIICPETAIHRGRKLKAPFIRLYDNGGALPKGAQ